MGRLLLASLLLAAPVRAGEADAKLPAGRDFGAGLTLVAPTPLARVLEAPERWADTPVLVRGKLADVCQKKGCWTVVRDGDAQVRVRFHDYGFFLPTDSIGAEALVEGRVSVLTLSEKEARHYESESADGDPARIQGPQREISFTATGVRLLPRD